MPLYLALLRGINVGGKNKIKMADLAACFESLHFSGVRTYIQSGNVIFQAAETDQTRLRAEIEAALSAAFHFDAVLVLRSHAELRAVVEQAPDGFGSQPKERRYNVLFLKKPLQAEDVLAQISPKPGVDQAYSGRGVLYFSNLISKAGQSRLSRIIQMPFYPDITIRNWNTTTRLFELLNAGR